MIELDGVSDFLGKVGAWASFTQFSVIIVARTIRTVFPLPGDAIDVCLATGIAGGGTTYGAETANRFPDATQNLWVGENLGTANTVNGVTAAPFIALGTTPSPFILECQRSGTPTGINQGTRIGRFFDQVYRARVRIGEIIAYNRDISAAEFTQIRNYANAKWVVF